MPSSALCPCLGTSSHSPGSPLSTLRERLGSQEGAARISREVAPAPLPRTRPHPTHGEAGGGLWLPGLQNNASTKHPPLAPPVCPLGGVS